MEQLPPTAFLLEFSPTDASDADPTLIDAIARDVVTRLREQGETIQPVYNGQRGGDLLLQIVSAAWMNRDILMSDLSSLVTILTPVVLIAQHIRHAYTRRVGAEATQQKPVTVTLEVNGLTMKIETVSATDATEVATKLAQYIQAQPLPSGEQTDRPLTPKVKAHIPKRSTSKKH
jgi:hypothetical protein